ncbi:MAG: hypothetical protein IPO67_31255 [Deltaproteobacteria bacterium]|nr:hypothetical protein [Deltaproteobacteria bacterium]
MVTLSDTTRALLTASLCLVISGCSLSMDYSPYNKSADGECSGLAEIWYDGIDQDCDGNDGDQDGDGFVPDAYVAAFPDWQTRLSAHATLREGDCWDDADDGSFLEEAVLDGLTLTPDLVSPDAEDVWYDGVDQDCDGANDFDQDGDGFDSANDEQADGSVGDDCVDGSANDEVFEDTCSGELITVDAADAASVNPGATETYYDGIDQDCDGADDNDADGDGYAVCDECDDTDPETFPSDIPEIWYDCQDQNCDGNDGDMDGDGYVDAAYTTSCTDWASINPGQTRRRLLGRHHGHRPRLHQRSTATPTLEPSRRPPWRRRHPLRRRRRCLRRRHLRVRRRPRRLRHRRLCKPRQRARRGLPRRHRGGQPRRR